MISSDYLQGFTVSGTFACISFYIWCRAHRYGGFDPAALCHICDQLHQQL